ncbi:reverse transcriptase domain-containing protein [Tanacetum coccineum]
MFALAHRRDRTRYWKDQVDWKKKIAETKAINEVLMTNEKWSLPCHESRTSQPSISIAFSSNDPIQEHCNGDNQLIIKADIKGCMIHRIYVDKGSSTKIMYEHCFQQLSNEEKTSIQSLTSPLVGFCRPVAIDANLSPRSKEELQRILSENLDVFAWSPSDMTGIPRELAEHNNFMQEKKNIKEAILTSLAKHCMGQDGKLLEDPNTARKIKIKAPQYFMKQGVLYMKGYSASWLRCVGPNQARYVLQEAHFGSCGAHAGARTIVQKATRQKFTSVAHLQANDQTKVTNRTLLHGLKTRLGKVKGQWVEELSNVLWAHRTTAKTGNHCTSFILVYGSEAVLPPEIGVPTYRIQSYCNTLKSEYAAEC